MFGPGNNPCNADDCTENACACTLSDWESTTAFAGQCPDTTTIAVTTSDGTCTLRETANTGFSLTCMSGSVTASGFTDRLGDVDMVTLLDCKCPGSKLV